MGLLVLAKADEPAVSKVTIRRPLDRFELPDQQTLKPTAVLHLRSRQSRTPSAGLPFRKVCEWETPCCGGRKSFHNSRGELGGKPFRGPPAYMIFPLW